jgi:hypothetical protein
MTSGGYFGGLSLICLPRYLLKADMCSYGSAPVIQGFPSATQEYSTVGMYKVPRYTSLILPSNMTARAGNQRKSQTGFLERCVRDCLCLRPNDITNLNNFGGAGVLSQAIWR